MNNKNNNELNVALGKELDTLRSYYVSGAYHYDAINYCGDLNEINIAVEKAILDHPASDVAVIYGEELEKIAGGSDYNDNDWNHRIKVINASARHRAEALYEALNKL